MLEFTKEELDIIYLQLSARKQDFEEMAIKASENKDIKRTIECVKYIEKIQAIMEKCLKNKNTNPFLRGKN